MHLTDYINDCFRSLIKVGFLFDSIEYVQPLNSLIEVHKTTTQISVLNQLIRNKVSIDTSMIQRALESCFEQMTEKCENKQELEDSILSVTKSVLQDPGKYLTYDFMVYLLNRLMAAGREIEAERILLDPRISVTLYPELWSHYIEIKCQKEEFRKALALIDDFKSKSVSENYVQHYNKVLEKFA